MNEKQQVAIARGKKDYLETGDVYSAVNNMMFYIDAPLSDEKWAEAVIEFLTWVKDQTKNDSTIHQDSGLVEEITEMEEC